MASIKLKGDTSGEITIQAPSVAGTNTLNLQASSGTLATTAQASVGTKNLIINGDMRIAQRGTSVAGITSTTSYLTVDRFFHSITNIGTWSSSQDTDAPEGFGSSLKLECTASASLASNSLIEILQIFEGQNLQQLKKGTANAESVTISFWVKSNKIGDYVVGLLDNDNGRDRASLYTINTANTWEKKTVTFEGDITGALDNDANGSFRIRMCLGAGTNFTTGTLASTWQATVSANRAVGQVNLADSTSNYINITGVQLEVGTEATPFENRPYDMELARCQRYFENLQIVYPGIYGANYGSSGASIQFKVQKRIIPSITDATVRNAASGATASVVASTGWTTLCVGKFPYTGLTGTAGAGQGVHVYATNGIHVDAEL